MILFKFLPKQPIPIAMNNPSTRKHHVAWLLLACWLSASLLALWAFEKDSLAAGLICSTSQSR